MSSFFSRVSTVRALYTGTRNSHALGRWIELTKDPHVALWAVQRLHVFNPDWVRALLKIGLLGIPTEDAPLRRGLPTTPLREWAKQAPELATEVLAGLPLPDDPGNLATLVYAVREVPPSALVGFAHHCATVVRSQARVDNIYADLCLGLLRTEVPTCRTAGLDLLDALLRARESGGSTSHAALRIDSYWASELARAAADLAGQVPELGPALWLDLLDAAIRSTSTADPESGFDSSDYWFQREQDELAALAEAVVTAADLQVGDEPEAAARVDTLLAAFSWRAGWRLRVRFACERPRARAAQLRTLSEARAPIWTVAEPPSGTALLFRTIANHHPELAEKLRARCLAGPEMSDPAGWEESVEWLLGRGLDQRINEAREEWIRARLQLFHTAPAEPAAHWVSVEDPPRMAGSPAEIIAEYEVLLPSPGWDHDGPGTRLHRAVSDAPLAWAQAVPRLLERSENLGPWLPKVLQALSFRDADWKSPDWPTREVLRLARTVAWSSEREAVTAALWVAKKVLDQGDDLSRDDRLALASITIAGLGAAAEPTTSSSRPIDLALTPPRSRAIGLAIRLGIYFADHPPDDDAPDERPWPVWLLRHVSFAFQPDLPATRAALGLWFPQLVRLSEETARAWTERIFMPEQQPKEQLALSAYLVGTRPYDAVLPLIRPVLQVHLERNGWDKEERQDEARAFAFHIGSYLWRGLLGSDDELVVALLRHQAPARWLLHHLGRGLCEVKEAPPTRTLERLQNLWSTQVEGRLAGSALAPVGRWCLSEYLSPDWRLDRLAHAIERATDVEKLAEVVAWLVDLERPQATALALDLVTRACAWPSAGRTSWNLQSDGLVHRLLDAAETQPELHGAALAMADALAVTDTCWWCLLDRIEPFLPREN